MKISELPEPIKTLAEHRRYIHEIKYSITETIDDLALAFDWFLSKEGMSFWAQIDIGSFSIYSTLYPKEDQIANYFNKGKVNNNYLIF